MNLTATTIQGQSASRGRHTGAVRIVGTVDDARAVQPGDVVVCATASPRIISSLPHVGALILDRGGTLSNAATIARELGIPTVVATGDASRILRDGQRVTVDGASGIVRLCESDRAPAA